MSEGPNLGWKMSLKLQIYWIKVKNFQRSFLISTLKLSLQNVLCWITHQLSSVKQPRSLTRGWVSFQTHQLTSFSLQLQQRKEIKQEAREHASHEHRGVVDRRLGRQPTCICTRRRFVHLFTIIHCDRFFFFSKAGWRNPALWDKPPFCF